MSETDRVMEEHYAYFTEDFNDTFNLSVYYKSFKCSKIEINLSTCLPIQTEEEMDSIESLCEAADSIWITGFWFSVVTGIIGNSLALITITSLPSSTATFFVGLLAASDLVGVSFQALVHFLDKYRTYSRISAYWDLFLMLYDISASYSNWLLVLICLERYFTIRFPLHKRYYFTLTHAKICSVIIALAVFSVYNIATWTLGYDNMQMFKIRNLVYAGLPLTFILFIIGLISYQLRKIHQDRESLNGCVHSRQSMSVLEDIQTSRSNSRRRSSIPLQEIARLENSITVMMLVAAVCFTLLTIPNCILLYTYLDSVAYWNTPVLRAQWYLFQKISQVFTYLNLSVNFVLYFLSAKKFRSQLFKVFSRKSILFRRNLSQYNAPINNNSKTDNSHHMVYVDYMICNNPIDRGSKPSEHIFQNITIEHIAATSLPEYLLTERLFPQTDI